MNIFLIHGLGGSGRYFGDLELRLKNIPRVRTYAPDLLGFGRNAERLGPFTLEIQLGHLTKEAKSTFGDDAVIVLGHSMGGVLAVEWAVQNPKRVKGIILLNTPLGDRESVV